MSKRREQPIETRTEIRDGREYAVAVYPDDWKLEPGETKKRALFAALDPARQKAAARFERKQKARRRARQFKRASHAADQ